MEQEKLIRPRTNEKTEEKEENFWRRKWTTIFGEGKGGIYLQRENIFCIFKRRGQEKEEGKLEKKWRRKTESERSFSYSVPDMVKFS